MKQTNRTDATGSCAGLHADRDGLVNAHIGLAYSFARGCQNRGLPLEDLRQEALLGLLEAAERFDPGRGTQFGTYAVHWIRKRLLAALDSEKAVTSNTEPLGERDLAAPDTQTEPRLEPAICFPASMPVLEQGALHLSINQGLTLKEVAIQLGISVERVKQLRGKALRRLRP